MYDKLIKVSILLVFIIVVFYLIKPKNVNYLEIMGAKTIEKYTNKCLILENFSNGTTNWDWAIWDGRGEFIVKNGYLEVTPQTEFVWLEITTSPPIDVSDYSEIVIRYSGDLVNVRYRINNTYDDIFNAGETTIHLKIDPLSQVAKIPLRKEFGNYLYHIGFLILNSTSKIFNILLC